MTTCNSRRVTRVRIKASKFVGVTMRDSVAMRHQDRHRIV
jgi:hypothetical protein